MDEKFIIFLIEIIPLAILIGIGAACFAYTAWNIIVPLVFVGLGFGVYDAIVMSLIVDFFNSLILIFSYSRHNKVVFKEGIIWGLVGIIGAVIGAIFGIPLLLSNQDSVKGGIAWLVVVLGLFFLNRGRVINKKEKDKIQNLNEDSVAKEEEKTKSDNLLLLIMIIGAILSGLVSGLLGQSGGANYVLLYLIVFGKKKGFDTLIAAGTSSLSISIITGILILIFSFNGLADFVIMGPYIIVAVIASAIGTILGSKVALKISEAKLNFLIGIVMIIAAIVSTVQSMIIV